MTEAGRTRHFGDLDGMRGVLAVLVMLHHYGLNTVINRVVPLGHVQWTLCVDLFFILSGFVLCRSVAGKGTGAGHFAWKRFGRLFPMHWAILLIFAPVFLLTSPTPADVAHEAFVTGPLVGRPLFNGPAWSMAFEFYIPVAIVLLMNRMPLRWGWAVLPAVIVFVLAAGWLCHVVMVAEIYSQVTWLIWLRALAGLGLGFLCWALFRQRGFDEPRHLPSWHFPAAVTALIALILLGTRMTFLGWLLPVAAIAVLYVGMHTQSLLSAAPFALLGRLSFGIYMVHVPVLHAYLAIFGEDGIDGNAALKGLMCVSSVTLAYILHRLVERPFMRLFRGDARSGPRPGAKRRTPVS